MISIQLADDLTISELNEFYENNKWVMKDGIYTS
jgi:hypothetical protein